MSNINCASIIWDINNFDYCWQKNGEAIVSPMFSIYVPEETKWKLMLFPRGEDSNEGFISLFLYRDKDCDGAENIEVEYSLDILKSDGSYLDNPGRSEFRKNERNGISKYIYRKQVIEKEVRKFMPQNTLSIRCKMIRFDGKTVEKRQIFARTIIGVENRFFQWSIENFSSLSSDQTRSFSIKSEPKELLMQINLAHSSVNSEKICFRIFSFDPCMKFTAVKTFIIDSDKHEIDSGEYEYWSNCGNCPMFLLKQTKKYLIENRSRYLPNDILTLSFELVISTGFAFEGIEKNALVYTPHSFPNNATENWRKCIAHKKMPDCPCALVTDLTSLLEDQRTCDIKLQAKTNMFPVHSSILSARSPVFKAMFLNDMKEKESKRVDASDLQDKTVRQFLSYLYSDQLEDLDWDNALQLYKTADKYQVISLREKCSLFLKNNLNLENACEALMISNLHLDRCLKEVTQNFILKNAKAIFKSEDWKHLEEADSKLALETTLRNWTER